MHENIHLYLTRFPGTSIREAVLPCADGYTIYLDDRLTYEQQLAAYSHALFHIKNRDFEKDVDVGEIERIAHQKGG